MKLVVKRNREIAPINSRNSQNENKAETIELSVPEEFESFNKKIVFITPNETVWDVIVNNQYKITNAITKYDKVDYYIWLTKEVDGESIDFRTKTRPLSFYPNKDASDEITDEEIHGVNTVVNLLEEEIEKVENLNIEATKIGDTTTVTITKKDGTTESVEINDGQDGYTPQKGIDYFTEQDIEEIETDVKNNLEENVLVNYSLIAETGAKIELSINQTNYKLTAILKDKNNNIIHTSNVIDLPLETMVVNATYDNTTKKIILILQNGTTVEFSVADLVSGLVSESQLQTILSNYYTKTEINNLLANKVDKVAGKGLSTNDFTDEYKEQVDTNTEDIEDIQEEQAEQNTDIEKLQTENARLKATLPTTTGEGQDVTLNKTAELEFKKPPLPMGNSEQEGEPSPNNEVPIINVTGDVEVVVENKNLLKPDDFAQKVINSPYNAGNISTYDSETGALNVMMGKGDIGTLLNDFKENTRYTIIFKYKRMNTSDLNSNISIQYTDGTVYDFVLPNENGVLKYITTNNKTVSKIYHTAKNSGGTRTLYLKESGIFEGVLNEIDFILHKEQKFTFPLGNEKLMLGDYLADDGIHHKMGEVVFDGVTEGRKVTAIQDYLGLHFCMVTELQRVGINGYNNLKCTHFIGREYTSNCIYVTGTGKVIVFIMPNQSINTPAKANDWLAEQYANSTPLIVQYELAEEIIVPYTSAQQEVYNQIKQALSYEEQTNISSNQNALFDVEAYQNTKLILQDISNAIIALGGV